MSGIVKYYWNSEKGTLSETWSDCRVRLELQEEGGSENQRRKEPGMSRREQRQARGIQCCS